MPFRLSPSLAAPSRPLALHTPAAEPAAPPARVSDPLIFPDGLSVGRLARGVYRMPCLWGDSWVVFAVDSAADTRGLYRRVPMVLGAAGLHAAERELAAALDQMDPPPRPLLVRD